MFYCFSKLKSVKLWHLKLIPYSLILSFIFDVTWLVMYTSDFWSQNPYDGDVEMRLRRFVLLTTYFSFVFRILIFMIFLKV